MNFFVSLETHPWLKTLSRYSGIDIQKAFKNSSVTLARQIVTVLCGLIINALLARYTNKTTFGTYTVILSMIGIASLATLPGLNTAVLRAVARGAERFYNKAVWLSVASGFVGTFILIVLWLAHLPSLVVIPLGVLSTAAVLMPFSYGFNTWESYNAGKSQFARSAKYGILQITFTTLVMIGAVLWQPNNLWVLVTAFVGSSALTNAIAAFFTLRETKGEAGTAHDTWLGVHLTWINALPSISDFLDNVLLLFFLGPVMVANYTIANAFPNAINSNMKTLLSIFSPQIAASDTANNVALLRKNALILIGMGIGLGLVAWFLIPYFLPLIFGSHYHDVIVIAQFISITLIFKPFRKISQNIVLFEGKITANTVLSFVPIVCRIVSYPFLLPHYALSGMVIALVIEEVSYLIMAVIAFRWLRLLK